MLLTSASHVDVWISSFLRLVFKFTDYKNEEKLGGISLTTASSSRIALISVIAPVQIKRFLFPTRQLM